MAESEPLEPDIEGEDTLAVGGKPPIPGEVDPVSSIGAVGVTPGASGSTLGKNVELMSPIPIKKSSYFFPLDL
jgi:hypothetical protein